MRLDALSRAAEHALVPAEHQSAQTRADHLLRSRLPESGLTLVPNSGEGNLCLILAMAQVAGVAPGESEERARGLQARLAAQPDELGQALLAGQGLYADRAVFQALAEHVFGAGNVHPMLIMTAGEHGMPLLFDPFAGHADAGIDLDAVPHHTAVLLESPGHFEAVANTSGRPWSTVLRELGTAPEQPDGSRRAAWLEDAARWEKRMAVETVDQGAECRSHAWVRGAQTRLTVRHSYAEGVGPLQQARALAEAQGVLDDFWKALEGSASLCLHREQDGDVHLLRLGVTPAGDYMASLSKEERGFAHLPGLLQGEGPSQYTAELLIHQDRIVRLLLCTSGEGDMYVEFEGRRRRFPAHHPPEPGTSAQGARNAVEEARPLSRRVIGARSKLNHPDDLSAFNQLANSRHAPPSDIDLRNFSLFLRTLRAFAGWKDFHAASGDEQRATLSSMSLHKGVAASTRRMLDRMGR